MTTPRQEPGGSLRLHSIILHEPFGLPLHHQTGVWYFMRLNNAQSSQPSNLWFWMRQGQGRMILFLTRTRTSPEWP